MRDHKSLIAWQEAHAVVRIVLRCCREHWRPHASSVFDQLQRASLSVQLNIAEGHALRAPARFRNHLLIAYGSAVETIELLEILVEEEMIPSALGQSALGVSIRVRGLLLGLMQRYRPGGEVH